MQAVSSSPLVPILLLVCAMTSVLFGAALAKGMFPIIGPEGAATLRLVYAIAILWGLWRPWTIRLTKAQWLTVLVYGLSVGGMNLLIYIAMSRIPLGIAVALEFVGPLGVALWGSRRPLDLLWVGLAATGVLLFLPFAETSKELDPLGLLAALAAGMCWAIYIVFGKRAGAAVPGGTAIALGMTIAGLLVLPFGVAAAGSRLFDPSLLPLALTVAVLSNVVPYSLEMIALRRLSTKTFGILMSMEPAIGSFFGFVVLHEHLEWSQVVAILCIIAASVGTTAAKETTTPEPIV